VSQPPSSTTRSGEKSSEHGGGAGKEAAGSRLAAGGEAERTGEEEERKKAEAERKRNARAAKKATDWKAQERLRSMWSYATSEVVQHHTAEGAGGLLAERGHVVLSYFPPPSEQLVAALRKVPLVPMREFTSNVPEGQDEWPESMLPDPFRSHAYLGGEGSKTRHVVQVNGVLRYGQQVLADCASPVIAASGWQAGSLRVQTSKLELLRTTRPGGKGQLWHTDGARGTWSLIVPLSPQGFNIRWSPSLWEAIKARGYDADKVSAGERDGATWRYIHVAHDQAILFDGCFPHAGAADSCNDRLFIAIRSEQRSQPIDTLEVVTALNTPELFGWGMIRVEEMSKVAVDRQKWMQDTGALVGAEGVCVGAEAQKRKKRGRGVKGQ
jgi:hypothetical protein